MDSRELSANDKFSRLWGKYENHAKDPVAACFLLDTMQFIKLQSKNRAVTLLEASLARNAYDDAVKRSLVNLLASQFARDQSISQDAELRLPDNQLVIASLRKAADSPDPAIARQATLQYSRIGEPWEGVELLRAARSKALIDTTEYVRELAFLIPSFADPARERELLSAIEDAGLPGQDLADIMATMAQLPHALASLSPDTLLSVRRILEAAPPEFGNDFASLDVLSQARYNIWANAHSMITSTLDGKPVPGLLVDLVMAPETDPHALIAVVTSSRSDAVLDILAERGLADDVRSKLDQFRLAHPNSAEASGIASEIQALLAKRAQATNRPISRD